jgi:serine/threonine protein kinase
LLQYKYERELIKLTDFGLAIRNDNPSGPMTCSPFGTKGYIDPVALATGVLTKESDIFSLGKTMRELLTGNREPMFLTMLPGPPEFRTLIESMTSLDVSKRPSAQQIYKTVEELLSVPEMPPLQISGKGLLAAAAGVAALFILGNSNTWDEKAGQYRNSKGQFASGWLG